MLQVLYLVPFLEQSLNDLDKDGACREPLLKVAVLVRVEVLTVALLTVRAPLSLLVLSFEICAAFLDLFLRGCADFRVAKDRARTLEEARHRKFGLKISVRAEEFSLTTKDLR